MSVRSTWNEIRFSGTIGAICATALGLLFLLSSPIGQGLAHLSYNLPFPIRSDIAHQEAVIVYMDDKSHDDLNQPRNAPWDRTMHARLLHRLKDYSASVVAFDIGFADATNSDSIFAEAITNHGNVVLGVEIRKVQSSSATAAQTLPPTDELRRVATWGVTERTDKDGMVRQHYTPDLTNRVSLAWRAAEVFQPGQMPDLFTRRDLNYYGKPYSIPWERYADVISNTVPSSNLFNKVVFVGAGIFGVGPSGGQTLDEYRTPYTYWTRNGDRSPGVEINTTAFLNLIHREWLTRLSPARECFLILFVGALFGYGLCALRPQTTAALSVSAILLLFAIACALVWRQKIWFPWAIPCFVQIPCAATWAIIYRAQRLFREKETLEEKLATRLTPPTTTPIPTPELLMAAQMRAQISRSPLASPLSPSADHTTGTNLPTSLSFSPPHAPIIPNYTLLRCIGAGAYGDVWLGRNVLDTYRAVKIVYRHRFQDERPFQREFDGIRCFDPISRNHPGLVHLLHVGLDAKAGFFYYEMELADDVSGAEPLLPDTYEARTLSKELQSRGRLQVPECIQIALELTDSLEFLHQQQLIHRDIKPSNIIFVKGRPKLADIGLVTHIGDGQTFVGTEGFISPEGPGSPSSDLFSLGKVLYQALTGCRLNQFPDLPSDLEKGERDLFQRFNRVVLRACEDRVAKRYATAQEMHNDLLQLGQKQSRFRDLFKRAHTHQRPSEPSE